MTNPQNSPEANRLIGDLLERLESYREWHEAAIPEAERDDYEKEYLLGGSAQLVSQARSYLKLQKGKD